VIFLSIIECRVPDYFFKQPDRYNLTGKKAINEVVTLNETKL
jgi:hypothetical protein